MTSAYTLAVGLAIAVVVGAALILLFFSHSSPAKPGNASGASAKPTNLGHYFINNLSLAGIFPLKQDRIEKIETISI
jgi:hypothetical protein